MEKIKIITLCGSLKYIEKMWEVAENLSLERGYAVIGVNPHVIGRPLPWRRLLFLHFRGLPLWIFNASVARGSMGIW